MVYVDVLEDAGGMRDMLKASKGQRAVPVILDHGRVVIGYGGT